MEKSESDGKIGECPELFQQVSAHSPEVLKWIDAYFFIFVIVPFC